MTSFCHTVDIEWIMSKGNEQCRPAAAPSAHRARCLIHIFVPLASPPHPLAAGLHFWKNEGLLLFIAKKIEKPTQKGALPMSQNRKKEFFRALKFLLFSISAGIIQIASFTLLLEVVGLVYWQSYLISLILSVLWNFTFNRRYTFQSAANVPRAMALVALFYVVFTPLSTWGGHLLAQAGVNEYIIEAGTMILNFALEFLYQRFVVFKNSLDTRK